MDKLIQEIEAELQKTRETFGLFDRLIKNVETEVSSVRVSLDHDDEIGVAELLESDNPYHGGFGNFQGYWKLREKEMGGHMSILVPKLETLASMLRDKYDIVKDSEKSEHQPDACDCLLGIEIDDIVVRDSFNDLFQMKRQKTPVMIRDGDGEWTRTKPDTGVKIVKTTEFFLSDDEIKKIIDFNKSKDEKLDCNEEGTMYGSKAPEGGVRLITGSAGGTDGIIEISNQVMLFLEKMHKDSY